ncbi:hypothetical protein RclHR1_05370006 [Rhizophagus clarus]|uniref:Heme peroxidase n=1 Tax=Rhizophagus clarus TaxID=94130 RepID=A0A2Z6RNL0_9GLOM|nr:hypothetical protein RclHR1_05370006 [Rhizophagus clarus]GES75416.1 heme peroxidase [Rhizophagus clarus]
MLIRITENKNNLNLIFLILCFIKTGLSQYNPSNDEFSYSREFPPDPFYPDGVGKMLKTPIDFLPNNNAAPTVKCIDPLPVGAYPLPRCISNEFAYNLGPSINITRQSELRSKRRTNHMATWFGQYISFIITVSSTTTPSNPIYIPADDATFNPPGSIPGELPAEGITSLPFNLSDTLPGTPDPLNSVRNGVNLVNPFLDLETVYGTYFDSDGTLRTMRDGTSCKLSTSNNGKYPPKDANGNYIKSTSTESRSWSIFTQAINTIWIREHNRKCDELFNSHGNSWTNDQYFEEAKRWNIAFFQKTVSEEYLGTVIGRPLPAYTGYQSNIVPGIDTFFATVSFKYGHSELSDYYRIQDVYGDTMYDLSLDRIQDESLLETFSLERILTSMAMQRQEEVDVFFSDASRFVNSTYIYDLCALDVSRARDRGIALYNEVREAYGLPRKNAWNEITSDQYIINRLQYLYPNGTDTVEALVGAYSEDRLDSSNFGELLNASLVTQFNRLRASDKNWWESHEAFNDNERNTLRNTTFRDIIIRNLAIDGIDGSTFVKNIWAVQPFSDLEAANDEKNISPWSSYSITYRLDNLYIYFQIALQTAGGEGWFGMGFDPTDNGMTDAEFIIGIVKNKDIDLSNYNSDGGYHPPLRKSPEGLEIISKSVDDSSGMVKIQFRRLLAPPNRKPIRHGQMKYIMAYNPSTSGLSYHQNNRYMSLIDFYTREIGATDIKELQRATRLLHGIGMFITWCLLFPVSIFIVRFLKHTDNYLRIHRTLQLLGGISVSSLGAAAISTMSSNAKSPHAWTGLIIYVLIFFELGLGFVSLWGQTSVVSVNHGYPRLTKRVHKIFGITLLVASWINIYLGIDTFTLSFSYNPLFWKLTYGIWVFLLVVMFVAGEYWWNREGSFRRLYNAEEEVGLDRKKTMLYSNKEYDKLPEFTWEDINEHVQRGAFLVVCDGLVIDIRKWISVHPGGAKILEEVIGTDITNEFYDTHKKLDIVEDVETPETRLLLSAYTSTNNNTPEEHKFGALLKHQSVAKIIDKINTKYFTHSPLATHAHSAFATKKMMGMVIGKINEFPFTEPVSLPDSPIYVGVSPREDTKFDDMMSERIKFRRYKLTSRLTVNNNKKYPVIKFTFTKVFQDEKDYWGEIFLPGQYVEVKSRVKGQVVVRSYTPVQGRLAKSFSIYVKIYPNGLMSTHLNEQLKGFEIQVRGPFDVSDRINFMNNAPEMKSRISFQVPTSPTILAKSSLVNPNSLDGCWDELFMICGGTGITPMLQLIKYHLWRAKQSESVEENERKIHMYLLYGNRGVEDVIDINILREHENSSNGMLEISYIFAVPPPNESNEWPYLQGQITSDIIQKWFNDIKAKKSKLTVRQQHTLDFPPTFQPYPPRAGTPSGVTYTSQTSSFPGYGDNISTHDTHNTKIVVCGPADMMMSVRQTLVDMNYSDNDYTLLI